MYRRSLLILLILLVPFLIWAKTRKTNKLAFAPNRLREYTKYSRFIEAMAKHETGNFTSRLAREANNIFGMGQPYHRTTLSQGPTSYQVGGQYMSTFKSYDQAVQDLLLWFDYMRFDPDLETVDEFVRELINAPLRRGLKTGYFTDTYENYLNGLKRWL